MSARFTNKSADVFGGSRRPTHNQIYRYTGAVEDVTREDCFKEGWDDEDTGYELLPVDIEGGAVFGKGKRYILSCYSLFFISGSTVCCLEGNRKVVVACCEDCSINVYFIKSGARALPPLLIEDMAACLTLSDTCNCLVLTKTGLIHMWDFDAGKSVLNRVSVRSLLTNKATVVSCSLTSDTPLLTLSDGRAYLYNTDLQTWMLLSNPLDPMSRASGAMSRSTSGNLPLATLQRKMPSNFHGENLPAGVKLSFLESQVSASSILKSSTEFKHWLLATVNHLLEKGPECRLRSILDDLVGPIHDSARNTEREFILVINFVYCLG
ncbi:member of the hir1 family of wd-repeat protein [Holotrichia oblita]|uniref:Member of the hir1 family of wd-repeat protein n=1 Tax=Holotrichia oblita TaxID=644536 RepID=A0ACB9TZI8_HOLOL|nr:member of the hir1 family of wd-repeat protein [Holotrichia oblita]